MLELLKELAAATERGEPVALATVVEVTGSSPAKVGAKLLLRADGTTVGTAGGGKLEETIIADARAALGEGRSRLTHYTLREQGEAAIGTLCGGEVRVFIEVFAPRPRLLIVGGGHVGRPLAELARVLGYDAQVADVRPERGSPLDPGSVTGHTYIVLVTEDHVSDEAALRALVGSPAPYIGLIGSRQKCQLILGHLRADGIAEDLLARVRAPVGLDLGGTTPAEIALAILAEIELARHAGRDTPRSRR
jgi:xanthine dehydrogenase accessory factor